MLYPNSDGISDEDYPEEMDEGYYGCIGDGGSAFIDGWGH